jgi:Tfp pilus assembly protein FimV
MVLGIFRNNPNAFSQNNVNALIKNKKLKLPSVDYFDDHTHIEAREVLRDQNIEWNTKTKKIKKPKKVKKVSNKDEVKIEQLEKELLETKKKLKDITNINKTKKSEPILDSESVLTENNKVSKKDQSLKKKVEEKEEIITQEKLDEKNDGAFVSSISDIDQDKLKKLKLIFKQIRV